MEENEIKASSYIPLAKELKEKRRIMGLRSVHIHKELGINQGTYSKMENAFSNPEPALIYVRKLFEEWRDAKILSLKREIKKLENIK